MAYSVTELLAYLKHISLTRGLYWRLRGKRRASIQGTTTEYQVESLNEAMAVDYLIRTERTVIADLLEELRPDDVFFDIGANYGLYSCFAASLLSPDSVYAVEPYPPNLPRLRANHELNGTAGVNVVERAFSDAEGEVPFDPPSRDLAVGGISKIRHTDPGDYTVEAVTGDTVCDTPGIPVPTVLKIDVEGAESKVLEGLRETLAAPDCRVVYCELHGEGFGPSVTDYGAREADVRSLLESRGFTVESLQERTGETHLKAVKNGSR